MGVDPWGLCTLDINITGGPGWGGTAGIQIGTSGIYAYVGGGAATGAGASVTLRSGTPSPGVSANVTYSGGTGTIGGSVSIDYSIYPEISASRNIGAGWGVGSGMSAGIVVTTPILEWENNSNDKITLPNKQ